MKIRSKLILIAVVPIIILLCSSLLQYRISREVDSLNYRAIRSDEIYKLFSDLTVLTHEHYIYYELRAHEQWEATYKAIGDKIAANNAVFRTPEEQRIIREVAHHYKTIGYLFDQYGPHTRETGLQVKDATWKHFADRLTSRLLQELQTVAPLLTNLHDLNHNRAIEKGVQQDKLELAFLLTICLSVPGISWFVYRAFAEPVKKLRTGIEIMAGGDLEHRIGLAPKDEIGDLAVAFDRMAEQRLRDYEQLRRNKDVFESLYRISQKISESESSLKDLALEEVVRLSGSEIGFIFFLNEDETVLTLHAWSQEVMPQCAVAEARKVYSVAEAGLWGEGVRLRRPFIMNDYTAPPPASKGFPEGHLPIIRHMNVPLMDGDRIVLLAGVSNKGGDYTDEDVAVVTLLLDAMWRIVRIKDADRSLLRANMELEQRVSERTEELQASQDKFAKVFYASPLIKTITDLETGEIIEANEAFYRSLGYDPGEVMGRTTLDIGIWPVLSQRDRVKALLATTGECNNVDIDFRCKNGEIRNGIFSGRVIKLGERACIISIVVDVTDRLLLEKEVRQSEARYRSLFANNHTVMFLVDPATGDIVDVNPAAEAFYGYSAEQLRQMRIDRINCLAPEEIQAEMALAREEKRTHFLFPHRLADGSIRDVEVFSGPIMVNGRWLLYSIVHDVTERKQLEAETLRAREAAEQASRTKSEFLANMSHEIRTPMNAIIGLGHLALQTEMTPRQRDYLTKMHSSAQSLLGIINDILDFSKIEAGKLQLESVDFRLADVLDNLADLITVWAEAKGLEVLYKVDPRIPMQLRGDPLRLTQILTNLMNNAVKFTEHGEIILQVAVEELRGGEDPVTLLFSVRDSGIGINGEQLGQLFRPFSQADSSTTRRYGGTGLGLSICSRLVEIMGGDIWAESSPGQGSTFYFTASFKRAEKLVARIDSTPDLSGTRVLVVDDNAVSRSILLELLANMRLSAVSVSSGKEAIDELVRGSGSNAPFKLVIMDWRMPGMDGIETLERIRTEEGFSDMPVVIMVSAFATDDIRQRARDLSVGGFLAKPFHPQRLYRSICQALGYEAPAGHRGEFDEVAATDSLSGLEGRRILLVEDHAVNRLFAEEVLKNAGIEVEVAVNGQEAVALVEQSELPFDSILMDIQMPVMDGYEATRRIRALSAGNNVPIIAMTAHAMAEDRERCLEAGMNAHLSKPIDVMELYAALLRFFPHRNVSLKRRKRLKGQKMPPSELPLLPGIDIVAVLDRVDGNVGLLKKILEGFAAEKRTIASEIGSALGKSEWTEAERLAHGLKGVAGNLSAGSLAETAAGIEKACIDRSMGVALELLIQLEIQVTELISSIERFAAATLPLPAGRLRGDISYEQAAPVIQELVHLLRLQDLEAAGYCRRLSELMGSEELHRQALAIEELVSRLDFRGALSLLYLLAKSLDMTLEEA